MLPTSLSKTFVDSSDQCAQRLPAGEDKNIESDVAYDFAFQPIVNILTKTTYGHEALIRGIDGSGAKSVLKQVNNNYQFDQACRVKAIKTAREANLYGFLSIKANRYMGLHG